ncbi:hypothetical protein BJX68DRAFT_228195 [Aspergillus pseudodeflectus]|uniref:Actin n=1 Tax=Aspergillus pseudodeflectus TaxID=176178 RepID=A0ABR4L1C2_9EURO
MLGIRLLPQPSKCSKSESGRDMLDLTAPHGIPPPLPARHKLFSSPSKPTGERHLHA